MRIKRFGLMFGLLALLATAASPAMAIGDHAQPQKRTSKQGKPSGRSKSKLDSFKKLTKDQVEIAGLFTFYQDTTDNSMLMAISPDQIGPTYLWGVSIVGGDGAFVEGPRMFGAFPWFIKRVGGNLLFMERNVRIRADSSSTMHGAVERGISDALLASVPIKSKPQDSTKAILIDPTVLFVDDALNLSFFIGKAGKTGVGFDKKNSYFGETKSFPENSEVNVHLHFKTSNPQSADALQNPYSFFHVVHHSLSTLPKSDFVPRYADDRIGHFLTLHQDYSELDKESPYVRYINRWDLKKKNPNARISEPVQPIVYWVENTVPVEYRDAIADGIEFWQPAFERLGYRNGIVAKQMPDDAEWDPADVRYSTVRWLVAKNYPYVAIGPSRANPYTGQIYDADVGFVADAVRSLFLAVERRVGPLTEGVTEGFEEYDPFGEMAPPTIDLPGQWRTCAIGNAALAAAPGMAYLQSLPLDAAEKASVTDEYIRQFLTFVVAHEIGHTLGFRHNFIASSLNSLDLINNKDFTLDHGTIGTVMDYPAPNVAGPGHEQGEFYGSATGPYDNWIVEYSYADFGAKSPDDEIEQLNAIASRAPEHGLAYATDEDAYGSSMKGLDPRCNVWDLGDDAIAFCQREMDLSREVWFNLIKNFETPGTRYQTIRNVFQTNFSAYLRAGMMTPRYVGGLYHDRLHVGDSEGQVPFRVVPAAEQRRAINFLSDNLFAADAFDLPAELLNKLQEENLSDFSWSVYRRPTVDYPLHSMVLRAQTTALSRLYSPYLVGRLLNNLGRYNDGEEKYTMYDMFTDVRGAIWGELARPANINSFRRQLQLAHLTRLINIALSKPGLFPLDARSLAANDLDHLHGAASAMAKSSAVDDMTRAHCKEVIRQIEAAQSAERKYSRF